MSLQIQPQNQDKEIIYKPIMKFGNIISVSVSFFASLIWLYCSILPWTLPSQEKIRPWQNLWWWIWVLMFFASSFLTAAKWDKFFLSRLTITKNGIQYSHFRAEKFIPWEKVKKVGVIEFRPKGRHEYGIILSDSLEGNKNRIPLFNKSLSNQVIYLDVFIENWFDSELRSDIKRIQPLLPVK